MGDQASHSQDIDDLDKTHMGNAFAQSFCTLQIICAPLRG